MNLRKRIYHSIKFFTFGGAYSIDKMYRGEGISWFPEEIPSREEYEEGWSNLEQSGFQVDYILTHTGPREIVAEMGYVELSDKEVELRQFLQRVADNTDFRLCSNFSKNSSKYLKIEKIVYKSYNN